MGQENTIRLLASMEGPFEFMFVNLVKLVIMGIQLCSATQNSQLGGRYVDFIAIRFLRGECNEVKERHGFGQFWQMSNYNNRHGIIIIKVGNVYH